MKPYKISLILLSIVLSVVLIFYCIIYHDTDNVVTDFADCVSNKELTNGVENTRLYEYYNRSKYYESRIVDANVKVDRIFVLHNFKRGVMNVRYWCETFDKEGNHIYGSGNVAAKWYIEKQNGRWVVVSIEEDA